MANYLFWQIAGIVAIGAAMYRVPKVMEKEKPKTPKEKMEHFGPQIILLLIGLVCLIIAWGTAYLEPPRKSVFLPKDLKQGFFMVDRQVDTLDGRNLFILEDGADGIYCVASSFLILEEPFVKKAKVGGRWTLVSADYTEPKTSIPALIPLFEDSNE